MKDKVGCSNLSKELSVIFATEGRVSSNEHVEQASDAPHIHLSAVGQANDHFRSHKGWCSAACLAAFFRDMAGKTKVCN